MRSLPGCRLAALLPACCWLAPSAGPRPVQEAEDWKETVERLRATTEKDMWRSDLDAFEQVAARPGHPLLTRRGGCGQHLHA